MSLKGAARTEPMELQRSSIKFNVYRIVQNVSFCLFQKKMESLNLELILLIPIGKNVTLI